MRIGVIGCGKLGLCMAALFAKRGMDVVAADINQSVIDAINRGECPVEETGLVEMLSEVALEATTEIDRAVRTTVATFIIVPTPSGENGAFVNDYIVAVLKTICPVLAEKGYHLLVITSTVMPGSCQDEFVPLIEGLTGKKVGQDIGLAYNPEFIALGSVLKGMSNPDAILIGEKDRSGDWLEFFYSLICENKPPVVQMSWWNAEVAKIALNVFVTTKITLANTYARICEAIPGGNVDDVTGFLGLDSRIGKKYLKGGLGFGGPCFPRDNRAFMSMEKKLAVNCSLPLVVDTFNDTQYLHIAQRIMDYAEQELHGLPKVAAILGLTYKPDTPIVDESQSVAIAKELSLLGMKVRVHDPMGRRNAYLVLGDAVEYYSTAYDCVLGADIVVLATPWPEYKNLDWQRIKKNMKKPVMFDCWRMLSGEGFEYHALGVSDE